MTFHKQEKNQHLWTPHLALEGRNKSLVDNFWLLPMMVEMGRGTISCISALWPCLVRLVRKRSKNYNYVLLKTHCPVMKQFGGGKAACNRQLPCRSYTVKETLCCIFLLLLSFFLFLFLFFLPSFPLTSLFVTVLFARSQLVAVENDHKITSKLLGHPKWNTLSKQVFPIPSS